MCLFYLNFAPKVINTFLNVRFFVEELEDKPLLTIPAAANFLPIILLIDKHNF